MKRSRITSLRNFRRTEKFLTTAALAAAAASTVGLVNPASGATKTWLGTVVDTANAVNTTNLTYFTANSSLYKWDNSALNWTSGGAATTYAAGDDLVFNDNFNAGTLIEVNGTAQSPKSMTFAHVGPGVTNYNFLGGTDFQNATGGNIGSSSPFGTGHTTVLTLQSGFNGTVAFRTNSSAGATGESITINGGTLELHTAAALPNSGNTANPAVTLNGGELNVFVDLGGNVQPATGQLIGNLQVTANSVIANAAPNASRVWGGNGAGSINLATGVTLTVESITGGSTNTAGLTSTLNLATAGAGTILLQDFNTAAGTYTTAAISNNFSSGSANFDLGNGHSTLAASQATANLGALFGGANTTLAGSSATTFAVGSLAVTSTFNGNLSGGTLNKVGSTSVLNLAGVNTTTLALNATAGTLALSGPNGTAQAATYNATGGVFKLDNSNGNNNDRLNDTTPVNLNQGSFEFVGNLASQTNEVAGNLTIAGATNFKTTDFGSTGSATITFASLVRNNGIINFNLDPNTHVRFQTAPVSAGAIIGGFATTNSFHDWVSLDANNNVIAFSNYNTNADPTTWNATDVKVTAGSVGLATSTTVNSVNFASVGGGTLNIPTGTSFTVTGGGMLANTTTTISGGGTLTAGNGTAPVELDLVVPDPTQTLTINSVIADNGGPTGAVSLLKAGPGTLVLGASNTFSGALAVAGGALSVNAANLLSPNGGLTVDLGTTFDLNGFGQNVATITLINGTIKNTPGGAAAMNVSGAINIQSGTLSANLTGPAALTKTSGNTVTLTGSNSYTGGTTVSNGNLNVNSTTALIGNATFTGGTTNINSNTTLGAVVGSTGGSGATIAGTAVLTASSYEFISGSTTVTAVLAGANPSVGVLKDADQNGSVSLNAANTFTGPVTIQNVGTVSTNNIKNGGVASGLGASTFGAVNLVLDGGYLVYNGAATSTDRLFTITGNNGTIIANTTSNGALVFSNTGAIAGSGILTLRGSSTGANTVSESFTSGITVAKNDTGQWVLGQANTFSEIRPNNGTLNINANENVNVASFQGGLLGTASATPAILTVNNLLDVANGTLNVAVTGNATLQKDSGTFTINSTNSFTGGITIGGTGILNAAVLANGGSVSSIGQSSNADTNLVFNSTGTLSYIGAVATSTDRQFQLNANNAGFAANGVGSLATLTVANTFVLNDHSNTLNLGGANTGSNTFNPTIYGNGGLNKVDGGLWVLGSTANSFTGSVNLGVGAAGAGTLAVSSIADGGIQGPNINVTQGSNIATIDNTTGLVVGMTISASDQIAPGTTILAIGNGTITLSQPSPGNGGTSPNFGFANALGLSTGDGGNLNFGGGTLRYLGPTASTNRQLTIGTLGGGIDSSGTGPISFTNTASVNGVSPARTFTFSGTNTGSNTFAGQLADNGGTLGITKSGKGMWTLTGNNSYTGVTTVTSGTLSLAGAGAWAPALTGTAGTALTGGRLVFDYSAAPASNPVNTIKTILTTGSAGSFTTGQIRTTNAGDLKHGIGFIDNGSNVTVGYTYYGDANVDGQVTTADFVALSSHFNATTGVTWANGDFNYDGKINALDFNLLATNFGAAAIAAPLPDAPALLGSLVPEPTSLALLGGVAAMGLRRRRRAAR